jgi:hypothetical protein
LWYDGPKAREVSFSEASIWEMDMDSMSLGAMALVNQIHFYDSGVAW